MAWGSSRQRARQPNLDKIPRHPRFRPSNPFVDGFEILIQDYDSTTSFCYGVIWDIVVASSSTHPYSICRSISPLIILVTIRHKTRDLTHDHNTFREAHRLSSKHLLLLTTRSSRECSLRQLLYLIRAYVFRLDQEWRRVVGLDVCLRACLEGLLIATQMGNWSSTCM